MIAGYIGHTDEIDEALTKFAFAYAEQNEQDYADGAFVVLVIFAPSNRSGTLRLAKISVAQATVGCYPSSFGTTVFRHLPGPMTCRWRLGWDHTGGR